MGRKDDNGREESLEGIDMFIILTVILVSGVHIYVSIIPCSLFYVNNTFV